MPVADVHPSYRKALEAAGSLSHGQALTSRTDAVHVQATHGGIHLEAHVDAATHRILQAAHGGGVGLEAALMDRLCGVLEGLPLQEASDHGALHLEQALRDPSLPAPTQGLLIPERVEPLFGTVVRLLRMLLKAYRDHTGYADTRNGFSPKPSEGWAAKSAEQQMALISALMRTHAAAEGMEVVRMEGGTRVIVSFEEELSSNEKQARLMALEGDLRGSVESTLRIYTQPRVDENKLRNMKGVRLDP